MDVFNTIEELFDDKTCIKGGDKFRYRQVLNDGQWYIYEVRYLLGKHVSYEVFKRRVVPKSEYDRDNGKFVTVQGVGRVKYPSDEDFGKWAFSCPDIETCERYIKGELPNRTKNSI